MKKATESSQNKEKNLPLNQYNQRECPSCGMISIFGMPGGRDATCKNCGYKDPCCYD